MPHEKKQIFLVCAIASAYLFFSFLRSILPARLSWRASRFFSQIGPIFSWLPRRPTSGTQIIQVASQLDRWLGVTLNCLVRSLAIHTLANAFGLKTYLRVGIVTGINSFRAHAWVEADEAERAPSRNISGIQPFDRKIL